MTGSQRQPITAWDYPEAAANANLPGPALEFIIPNMESPNFSPSNYRSTIMRNGTRNTRSISGSWHRMNNAEAVIAGHICLDVYPDLRREAHEPFEKTVLPGRLIAAGPVTFYSGGTVANTGLSLHRLGIPTRLVGKLGDDLFGQQVLSIIRSHSDELANGMLVEKGVNTSYSIVINYPGADRIFFHCPGANDTFCADDIPYSAMQEARLFHFGYPPLMKATYQNHGAQLTEIFRRAKETGITTSLDMAFPDPGSEAGKTDWRQILQATLPWVDIFLPSVEEILFMLRQEQFYEMNQSAGPDGIIPLLTPDLLSEIGAELLGMGARMVVLKLGARGLYLRTADADLLAGLGRARPADLAAWIRRSDVYFITIQSRPSTKHMSVNAFTNQRSEKPLGILHQTKFIGGVSDVRHSALSG